MRVSRGNKKIKNKTPCENVAINKCCMKTIITNRLSFSMKEGEIYILYI